MSEKKWMNVIEIAKYIGVSKETVYRWLKSNTIPCHRVGKLWKFDTTEIDEWVKSGDAEEADSKWLKES